MSKLTICSCALLPSFQKTFLVSLILPKTSLQSFNMKSLSVILALLAASTQITALPAGNEGAVDVYARETDAPGQYPSHKNFEPFD